MLSKTTIELLNNYFEQDERRLAKSKLSAENYIKFGFSRGKDWALLNLEINTTERKALDLAKEEINQIIKQMEEV
jgi:hypothetical protein